MPINAHTQLNLVIGNPIKHSQSPQLHHMIYESLGINTVMIAVENPHLPDLIQTIRTLSVKLTAVTLPYKTSILDHVDSQSEAVKALQAANTLIYKNGKIHAENTDIDGIRHALSDVELNGKHILIMGAGGAARAVAYVLQSHDVTVYWANRTQGNVTPLIARFGGTFIPFDRIQSVPLDLIINTTPVGMDPNSDLTPLPGYPFHKNQIVFDLIYTPKQTRLLKEAKDAHATCISGMNMFIAQAIRQIELFSNNVIHDKATLELCHELYSH